MTLTVTYADEDTIALPAWLMKTLGLQVGQPIETIASHHSLYFVQPAQNGQRQNDVSGAMGMTKTEKVEEEQSLEALIAEIKAMPVNPTTIHPATLSIDQVLANLATNPLLEEPLTFTEWQNLWPQIEQEIDEIEYTDAVTEGLV